MFPLYEWSLMSQQRSDDGRCYDGNLSPRAFAHGDGAMNCAPCVDLDLEIRDGKIHTKLYDKRDAFSFELVPTTQTCLPWTFFVSSQIIRLGDVLCQRLISFPN